MFGVLDAPTSSPRSSRRGGAAPGRGDTTWLALPGSLASFDETGKLKNFSETKDPTPLQGVAAQQLEELKIVPARTLTFSHPQHGSVLVDLDTSRVFSLSGDNVLRCISQFSNGTPFALPQIRNLRIVEEPASAAVTHVGSGTGAKITLLAAATLIIAAGAVLTLSQSGNNSNRGKHAGTSPAGSPSRAPAASTASTAADAVLPNAPTEKSPQAPPQGPPEVRMADGAGPTSSPSPGPMASTGGIAPTESGPPTHGPMGPEIPPLMKSAIAEGYKPAPVLVDAGVPMASTPEAAPMAAEPAAPALPPVVNTATVPTATTAASSPPHQATPAESMEITQPPAEPLRMDDPAIAPGPTPPIGPVMREPEKAKPIPPTPDPTDFMISPAKPAPSEIGPSSTAPSISGTTAPATTEPTINQLVAPNITALSGASLAVKLEPEATDLFEQTAAQSGVSLPNVSTMVDASPASALTTAAKVHAAAADYGAEIYPAIEPGNDSAERIPLFGIAPASVSQSPKAITRMNVAATQLAVAVDDANSDLFPTLTTPGKPAPAFVFFGNPPAGNQSNSWWAASFGRLFEGWWSTATSTADRPLAVEVPYWAGDLFSGQSSPDIAEKSEGAPSNSGAEGAPIGPLGMAPRNN